MLSLSTLAAGCTRRYYRQRADEDVYQAVAEKSLDAFGAAPVFSIELSPQSRLYDPFDPDRPPLPPDDPIAHIFMHRVDGKSGYRRWHAQGDAAGIDPQVWQNYLPRDETGDVVLDLPGALQVATVNSREFQTELEDLYLAALDVSFERFRFDAQFFAGNTTRQTADGRDRPGSGGESSSLLTSDTGAEMRRLTASGGELVVGLANSIIWQFAGPNTDSTRSLLDFALVQPLLRFGGRDVVLEGLTLSERNLLANVRQMQQFQQGFMIEISTGRNSGEGPARRGAVGASGLGLLAGTPGGTSGAPSASGFFGLLQEQQQIRNQQVNVTALRDTLELLAALFEASRLESRLQVDQAQQALFNAQSSLLASKAAYQTRLDSFKINLGLPPDVPVRIEDPLVEQLNLVDPNLNQLQDQVLEILNAIRDKSRSTDVAAFKALLERLEKLQSAIDDQLKGAQSDLEQLNESLPARREQLDRLKARPDLRQENIPPAVYDVQTFDKRVDGLKSDFDTLEPLFQTARDKLKKLQEEIDGLQYDPARTRSIDVAASVEDSLLEIMLLRAAMRLEAVVLRPIEMEAVVAVEIARENRLDWMNARARLVDAWRLIKIDANALESDLNLILEGDVRTDSDNPVDFRAATGRLRGGIEFDSPITRLGERNAYRETLIEFQRARRDYMRFADTINQSLRNTLRIIDLSQLNFELRRWAVRIAIEQVRQARLQLDAPPEPGRDARVSSNRTRDLVSALSDLLDAQNDFLNLWVSYEVLRMLLDFELGTMQLDERGMWIDTGGISTTPDALEELPETSPAGPELPQVEGLPPQAR